MEKGSENEAKDKRKGAWKSEEMVKIREISLSLFAFHLFKISVLPLPYFNEKQESTRDFYWKNPQS